MLQILVMQGVLIEIHSLLHQKIIKGHTNMAFTTRGTPFHAIMTIMPMGTPLSVH